MYFILLLIELILFHWMEIKTSKLVKVETNSQWSIKEVDAPFKKASENQNFLGLWYFFSAAGWE